MNTRYAPFIDSDGKLRAVPLRKGRWGSWVNLSIHRFFRFKIEETFPTAQAAIESRLEKRS